MKRDESPEAEFLEARAWEGPTALETELWINALADRTPKGELLRGGLDALNGHDRGAPSA
jgi:hypothetical protein